MGSCVPAEGAQVLGGTEWDWGGFTREDISSPVGPHTWHVAETSVTSVEASGWVALDPRGAPVSAAGTTDGRVPLFSPLASCARKVGAGPRNTGLEPTVGRRPGEAGPTPGSVRAGVPEPSSSAFPASPGRSTVPWPGRSSSQNWPERLYLGGVSRSFLLPRLLLRLQNPM